MNPRRLHDEVTTDVDGTFSLNLLSNQVFFNLLAILIRPRSRASPPYVVGRFRYEGMHTELDIIMFIQVLIVQVLSIESRIQLVSYRLGGRLYRSGLGGGSRGDCSVTYPPP